MQAHLACYSFIIFVFEYNMNISANFDGGNIEVVSINHPQKIELTIRSDQHSHFFQWFYFRLDAVPGEYRMNIINAGKAAYLNGWKEYRAVASYDRRSWFRVETQYDGQHLIIQHTSSHHSVWFAYFTPYSYERHLDLVYSYQTYSFVQLSHLGFTLDQRDLHLMIIGEPAPQKKKCWLIARQHPGETMAQWLMEGLLERLVDSEDMQMQELRKQALFYVVPNMNPDGSVRGHLRTNAVGTNLNREWLEPSLEKSPEVYYVRQRMHETGVDFFLDVHGDEAIPYNFLAGCEGVPSYSQQQKSLSDQFKSALKEATREFQTEKGYPPNPSGKANLKIAANYVGETFSCTSFTLEMPFKDNFDFPDLLEGWSAKKSKQLGKDVLSALFQIISEI